MHLQKASGHRSQPAGPWPIFLRSTFLDVRRRDPSLSEVLPPRVETGDSAVEPGPDADGSADGVDNDGDRWPDGSGPIAGGQGAVYVRWGQGR